MNQLIQIDGGCEPVRVAQVDMQMASLDTVADDLTKMVGTIQQRLQRVLRQTDLSPNKSPEVPVPREVLVPLAEDMRGVYDRLNGAINSLRTLNSLIELS